MEKNSRVGDKESQEILPIVKDLLALLEKGQPARSLKIASDQAPTLRGLQLLTSKPVLYVCNVDEGSASAGNDYSHAVDELAASEGASSVVISAEIESELSQLENSERAEYMLELGVTEAGLDRMISSGYELLDLMTYFTAGPKESRAWTVPNGSTAPEAAGVIHTDFEKGFISCLLYTSTSQRD